MNAIAAPLDRLEAALAALDTIACAVSGGVDSLTLATFAHRRFGSIPIRKENRVKTFVFSEFGDAHSDFSQHTKARFRSQYHLTQIGSGR